MRRLGNYPYQTSLHTLTFHDIFEIYINSNIVKKGIAILMSTVNNTICFAGHFCKICLGCIPLLKQISLRIFVISV